MAKISVGCQEVVKAHQNGWQMIDFKGGKRGAVAELRRR